MKLPFALLHALREWRSGVRRIGWFTTSMALGIAVLVALYGFQRDVAESTRVEARALLGGDLRIHSSEPLTPRVSEILDSIVAAGGVISRGVSLATVVFSPESGRARLFQVNAVDPAFPLAGRGIGDPPEVPTLLAIGGGGGCRPSRPASARSRSRGEGADWRVGARPSRNGRGVSR